MMKGENSMNIPFMVGIGVAMILLLVGIIGLMASKKKGIPNKWALWLIIFACCALVSAVINYQFI